jgi:FkbM family methyltransferase
MLQILKSFVKANPTARRLAIAVRSVLRPTDSDLLQRLVRTAARSIELPVFVKVGANDGITGDPFGDSLLKNAAWRGLLIEPVPYCVERLNLIYEDRSRFTIDQVAVGRVPGTTTFYYVSEDARRSLPDLPDWYDQLGSFDRQHILKHLDGKLEPFIIAVDVNVDSLSNILRRHRVSDITLLHIDTEGYDLEVLKSVRLGEVLPSCIVIEHKHLTSNDRWELLALLEAEGYTVRNTGCDFFAMHREANHELHQSGRVGRVINIKKSCQCPNY